MKTSKRWIRFLSAALALWVMPGMSVENIREEVPIAEGDFKKLDTFEGVLLSKADKVYAAKDYRRAAAEYDSFVLQYPKSGAVPYALMRKGRSLQRDNKRFDAIKVYNEVLDYFPNATDYAGAALYYIGECNWLNGDVKEAMKAWSEMAKDSDYRKHFLAAGAINKLAENLARQDKGAEAAAYYEQVGVDFRHSNREAANAAIEKLVNYYVRDQSDLAKLRNIYVKCETFETVPRQGDEGNFWLRVTEAIDRNGAFGEADKVARNRYYQYWAQAMDGQHADWDDYQAMIARCKLVYEEDKTKWMARLDRQFTQYQKSGDYGRVIKWIGYYAGSKTKIAEYYAKLSFEKMTPDQIVDLIRVLYLRNIDYPLARNAITKLKPDSVTDDLRARMMSDWAWGRDEEGLRLLAAGMNDVDRGKVLLVRYYSSCRDNQADAKGLKLTEDLIKNPAYSKGGYAFRGLFLQRKRQWADAISAYRLADNPPETVFSIAECLLADGKRDQAVAQLREVENFFKDAAPEAALRIAYAYRDTGDQKSYIAALRGVLKRQPGSRQSSIAHLDLERLGFKIGGGVDAD